MSASADHPAANGAGRRAFDVPRCPTCGAQARRSPRFAAAGFVRCPDCTLLFRHPIPSDEQLADLYRGVYADPGGERGTTSMASSPAALRGHAEFVRSLAAPGAAILDFGCGTGELAAALQRRGFHVVGVDASDAAIAAARARWNVPFFLDLDGVTGAGFARFDIVVTLEVVEHLKVPRHLMGRLHDMLRPRGLLYLTTPNSAGLHARLKGSDWREARDPCHLALYDFRALRCLLERAGFSAVRHIRFSPLTEASLDRTVLHRTLQAIRLYGGLMVTAVKH